MEKIKLKGTYGYTNFISDQEKEILINWTKKNWPNFTQNAKNRRFAILKQFPDSPLKLINKIKNKIIKIENINEWKEEPTFYDYIGVNTEGGSIHPHTDPNDGDYTHIRYNVLLSYPEVGGESIYGNNINKLEENLVWRCIAGKVLHASAPVIGFKPRITLSLGFLIKENDRNN